MISRMYSSSRQGGINRGGRHTGEPELAIKSYKKKPSLGSNDSQVAKVPLTQVTFDSHQSICRRLSFLDSAACLEDLMNWKAHRFMNIGTRAESRFHIWVDSRFAVTFTWEGTDAHEVEIIDRLTEELEEND